MRATSWAVPGNWLAALSLTILGLGACGSRSISSVDSALPDHRARGDSQSPGIVDRSAPLPEGAPAPPIYCQTNEACPPEMFCFFEQGCGQVNGKGICRARGRIELCPDYDTCPDVCGCDGQSYCDTCEAHAAGTSVARAGKCCKDLHSEYVATVQAAKKCCASCDENLCTVKVQSELICGCQTWVSSEHDWAMKKLNALTKSWSELGCDQELPCLWDYDCPVLVQGGCSSQWGGTCQEAWK